MFLENNLKYFSVENKYLESEVIQIEALSDFRSKFELWGITTMYWDLISLKTSDTLPWIKFRKFSDKQ